MSGLFSRLVGNGSGDAKINYEKAKTLASADSPKARRELAARDDAQPEILYFLAEDIDVDVRRAVAANKGTPPHAGLILAGDKDVEVRCNLAQQISRLAPQLDDEARERVGTVVNQVLEKLARDQMTRVRRILAEELKETANVPASLIRHLAQDAEAEVAAPVLEFSPLLDDETLLEIIRETPASDALCAISRRRELDVSLSDAVVASNDKSAIAELLSNKGAQIREETLDRLIDRSELAVQRMFQRV